MSFSRDDNHIAAPPGLFHSAPGSWRLGNLSLTSIHIKTNQDTLMEKITESNFQKDSALDRKSSRERNRESHGFHLMGVGSCRYVRSSLSFPTRQQPCALHCIQSRIRGAGWRGLSTGQQAVGHCGHHHHLCRTPLHLPTPPTLMSPVPLAIQPVFKQEDNTDFSYQSTD